MASILAVDDDNEVLETLGRVLRHEMHAVTLVTSASKAIEFLNNEIPDLIILDVIMPEMDGVTLCRKLRRDSRFMALPILFLTARGSTEDIVTGLESGADDYIIKPFELLELRARISAVLRRGLRERRSDAVMEMEGLRLDSDTYRVTINDVVVQLTSTEHRLLRYLMEHPNQALSPSHLLQSVWEYPPNTGDPDLVRAHVRNLRAKLEKTAQRKYIRTIHGVGYMISA